MPTERQIQEMYDKQALHDNLMQYCRGLDRMDLNLLKSTYWPDSADDHGAFVGGGHEWCETALKYKEPIYMTMHHVSNVYSEIDGERAKRESVFMVVTNYKKPAVSTFKGGRYRDLCEKRNGEWKVLRRACIWDWCEQRPTRSGYSLFGQPRLSHWGAFYPDDPIYKDWWETPHTEHPHRSRWDGPD